MMRPEIGDQQADVPRVERADLDRGGDVAAIGEEGGDFLDRNAAVAGGAANQAITVAAPVGAVILEVDVADFAGHGAGGVERNFGDGERIGGVECDADVLAAGVAEVEQLL